MTELTEGEGAATPAAAATTAVESGAPAAEPASTPGTGTATAVLPPPNKTEAKTESAADDRPPLLPLSSSAAANDVTTTDQSRPKEKESDEKDRRVREGDDRDRQGREIRAGLHPLQHRFVFWYTRRQPGIRSQTSYEDNIKKIAEFSTVEGFWGSYCHLSRVSTLPNPTDLHLFKEGIRPLWEDAANRSGGKWIIRYKKLVSGRYWEDLVLAMIGDQLDYGDSVCGAVLSIRFGEDILSVWNRNAADNQAVMALRDSIKRHLHLPVGYMMEYKPHDASLRDNSSFRNTWLRG
jgi:translation initiation factor 4E